MSEVVERVVDEETLDEKTGLILRTTREGKTIVVSQEPVEYEEQVGGTEGKVTGSSSAKQHGHVVHVREGINDNTQGICVIFYLYWINACMVCVFYVFSRFISVLKKKKRMSALATFSQ